MSKMIRYVLKTIILIVIIVLIPFVTYPLNVIAESTDDQVKEIEKEIEDQKEKLEEKESELNKIKNKANEISAKIKNISGSLSLTKNQINTLNEQISLLIKDTENLNLKLEIKNQDIDEQKTLRNITLRDLYITEQKGNYELLLSNSNIVSGIQNSAYYRIFINDTKDLVRQISNEISLYESDKKELEGIKTQIEQQKAEMQKLATQLATQVNSAQGELASVSQKQSALQSEKASIERKLSELSSKQKNLLEDKTETFNTSVGDVPSTGDPNSRADYNPGFTKAFAAFSFGAPHRKGMSQYGAKGRADSGQKYADILKAYYGDIEIIEPDIPKNINTDKGTMEIDGKYLDGLAEMPASWPMEALKAQAIAARTYALSYVGWRSGNTDPNGRICTTESCQVWSSSKATSSSSARWHQAVEETKGKIMVGKETKEIFSAWYAATSGGYNYKYTSLGHTTRGGWDTKCSSRDCWTSDAYESIAGSPWFYKGWYKSRDGKSCGRTHPWLTEKEFADIIGAMVLIDKDSDNQKHLSQPDAKECYGENIDDTWSRDEVKEKTGIEKINDISVTYSGGGYTSEVKVKTNKGEYKFDGEEFKAVFNLRAPGVIHLKSLLFNIEMKD
jgi:peptidoglycan hydrolase-like amidase